jgi:hypothetical protein
MDALTKKCKCQIIELILRYKNKLHIVIEATGSDPNYLKSLSLRSDKEAQNGGT